MTDEGWEREESGCENDWDNASGDKFHWKNGTNTTIGRVTVDAFSVVDGDNTLSLVELYKEVDDNNQCYDKAD